MNKHELYHNHNYVYLLTSNIINRCGDSLDTILFTWLVYLLTNSAGWSAIIFGINQATSVIIQPFIGPLVENMNKKKVPIPMTAKPPSSFTPSPSFISVPLPAIVVATVTAFIWPAPAIICASQKALLAFSTLCGIFFSIKSLEKRSVSVTELSTTSTGWPVS